MKSQLHRSVCGENQKQNLISSRLGLIFFAIIFNFGNMTGCINKQVVAEAPSTVQTKAQMEELKKTKAYAKVAEYLQSEGDAHRFVFIPEGEFVAVFNPLVNAWVQKKWTRNDLLEIKKQLEPSLRIPLTARGFVKAANREVAEGLVKDETNYDAVWVRDSAWIFWNLQEAGRKEEARTLLLALWDYYSSPQQIQRLRAVINQPALVKDKMAVPHIRFDGASLDLGDVMVDGKPEVWNHRQMDAHGLFILGLMRGLETGLIQEGDFKESRVESLALFPLFFEAVSYWKLEDAGAWEEVDRTNTSSISIVARSMGQWKKLLDKGSKTIKTLTSKIGLIEKKNGVQLKPLLEKLVTKGMERVRWQLAAEGESPLYDPYEFSSLFRRGDAALFNVLLPSAHPSLSENELRSALASMEPLKRPAGILRYQNDSYQSGNFWIQAPRSKMKEGTVGTTGDTSDALAFFKRLEALIPHTEAQWFFDSQLAMARLELRKFALKRGDQRQAHQDLVFAQIHLKRALGQITGHWGSKGLITADGLPIKDWQIPESINTVVIEGRQYLLPSPITPLNWAKASLEMALNRMIEAMN